MSAHVLLNSLNELGKRDKMRGLLSILSLFRNEFNKFNNTKSTNVRIYLSYEIKNSYFMFNSQGRSGLPCEFDADLW